MGKHANYCKTCELKFSDDTKHLFPIEKHKLKGGLFGKHYRKGRCISCSVSVITKNFNPNKEFLIKLKTETPCADCDKNYPHYVMHFDHIKEKSFNIASRKNIDINLLKAEIAKCELVCANCHAERTFQRFSEKIREKRNNRIEL